jgi:hypothetical protein
VTVKAVGALWNFTSKMLSWKSTRIEAHVLVRVFLYFFGKVKALRWAYPFIEVVLLHVETVCHLGINYGL